MSNWWVKLGFLGDDWYTSEEWQEVRLSSKNHVDAPIIIPTGKIPITLQQYPSPKNEYGSRYTWVIPFKPLWSQSLQYIYRKWPWESSTPIDVPSYSTRVWFGQEPGTKWGRSAILAWLHSRHSISKGSFRNCSLCNEQQIEIVVLSMWHWEITSKGRFLQKGTNSRTALWKTVILGKEYFYDDLGNKGGLTVGSKFIMMGDQNLDPIAGKLWKII